MKREDLKKDSSTVATEELSESELASKFLEAHSTKRFNCLSLHFRDAARIDLAQSLIDALRYPENETREVISTLRFTYHPELLKQASRLIGINFPDSYERIKTIILSMNQNQ